MRKLLFLTTVLSVWVSCGEKTKETESDNTAALELSTDKWPKKLNVGPKANAVLGEWTEFNAMDISFDAIYNASNREDLSLTIENIIEGQKILEGSTYPVEFDKPQIKSRQKVFKTYVLKVKGDLIYRVDPQASVLEMIDAYNILRQQFNVMVNNTLDTKLILDE